MSNGSFARHAVGQPVRRTEDPRLLRGEGCYVDDLSLPGQAYAWVVRSLHAHGRIRALDVSGARAAPGVLLVVTAEDLESEGIGSLPCPSPLLGRDGSPLAKPERPCLARGRVRYRGEALAVVVAESAAQARDAAELVDVDLEALPAVTDAREALAPGAPTLHAQAPGNLALDWEHGDAMQVERLFATAHHVTALELRSNRVVVSAMEPRGAIAEYDAGAGRYVLHVPTQGVFGFRNTMASAVLRVEPERLRVRTYDVGGSFGMKSAPYPEYAPLLVAARRLGRAVRWCDERSDSFVSDQHGRDSVARAELAFDADGRILAGRVACDCNLGAYLTAVGPGMHTRNVVRNFPGPYRLPALHVRTRAAFTNTTPVGPYRGAGRPEGVYYMERLLDSAAQEMGIDRVELRRRNLVTPSQVPYASVSGLTYDSGDFPGLLDTAVTSAGLDGFAERRAASSAVGRLRGLGIACYLEVTGPPAMEMGAIHFESDGTVTMISGSLSYGQGHATAFAQIVSERLGVPFERLRLVQGDSDRLIAGAGSGGSRTAIGAGTLLVAAVDAVVDRGRQLAAELLEAAPEDVAFEAGEFRIVGTDRAINILDLAAAVRGRTDLAADLPDSLDAQIAEDSPPSGFPNGCHVAEVEIEPDTGVVTLVRYAVVDDFGTLINPLLVEGQVHGGIVQGLGQALLEATVYDPEGQLLSGSYMDYALPRADDVPELRFDSRPTFAATNPLGVKGCGEAGVTGALPAVMNAVVDALRDAAGIDHIDMPVTPERVWRALRGVDPLGRSRERPPGTA
jgi:carbon-monoxide dehydrogenase large subunit